jgi:hypothetical protein
MINYTIAFAVVVIGFIFSETMLVTGQEKLTNQSNSTNPDKQKIIVTWLEVNKPETDTIPIISVSSEDFWKIFGPLLEQSAKQITLVFMSSNLIAFLI